MNKGIFITGTDTGVGKTFIAVGLIKAIKKRGLNICPMKPVESGCSVRKGELIPEDAMKLISASGVTEMLDSINPYRLKHPLAPSVAAEIEGIKIDKKKIITAYKYLSKKYDITIVEGAGGIMVPVYRKYLLLDLMTDLRLPVLVVARPGLGTINHTLLTIDAARNRGLKVSGVIINCVLGAKNGLSEQTNPDVIEKLGSVPVLGNVPYSLNPDRKQVNSIFSKIAEKLFPV